jgi:hypothetical protein
VQRIAVTGHVDVPEDVVRWVVPALTERLGRVVGPSLHGITCLAWGADQLFASVVLALRGTFEVVLPARDYAHAMDAAGHGETFRALLGRASAVETMPYERSSREAYLAASEAMLNRCDLLLAVWNGGPSVRVGDTADVVAKAHERKVPVEVLWPPLAPPPVTPAGAPGRG